ncbi:MAG: ArsR family transcriptional regulator [Candidatus Thermoplasmatota archaeon]|nr:ArsR family transcriptional regulator [Candidatus Thermoplasmatota archaeon]
MAEPKIKVKNRRKIYRVVEEYPGLHMREIKRKADLSMNLVKYHLEQLEKHEVVSKVQEGDYKRYYPKEGKMKVDAEDKKELAILRKETPLSVVLYLLSKDEPVPHGEMKEKLDIPGSTLSYHLKKMLKEDIIYKKESGYRLSEPKKITRLLMEYEPPEDTIDEFIDLWESLSLK